MPSGATFELGRVCANRRGAMYSVVFIASRRPKARLISGLAYGQLFLLCGWSYQGSSYSELA